MVPPPLSSKVLARRERTSRQHSVHATPEAARRLHGQEAFRRLLLLDKHWCREVLLEGDGLDPAIFIIQLIAHGRISNCSLGASGGLTSAKIGALPARSKTCLVVVVAPGAGFPGRGRPDTGSGRPLRQAGATAPAPVGFPSRGVETNATP